MLFVLFVLFLLSVLFVAFMLIPFKTLSDESLKSQLHAATIMFDPIRLNQLGSPLTIVLWKRRGTHKHLSQNVYFYLCALPYRLLSARMGRFQRVKAEQGIGFQILVVTRYCFLTLTHYEDEATATNPGGSPKYIGYRCVGKLIFFSSETRDYCHGKPTGK